MSVLPANDARGWETKRRRRLQARAEILLGVKTALGIFNLRLERKAILGELSSSGEEPVIGRLGDFNLQCCKFRIQSIESAPVTVEDLPNSRERCCNGEGTSYELRACSLFRVCKETLRATQECQRTHSHQTQSGPGGTSCALFAWVSEAPANLGTWQAETWKRYWCLEMKMRFSTSWIH